MGSSITSRITYQHEGSQKFEFKHVLCEINSNILLSQDHFLLGLGNLEDDVLGPK